MNWKYIEIIKKKYMNLLYKKDIVKDIELEEVTNQKYLNR